MRSGLVLLASLLGCQADPSAEEARALLRHHGCIACHQVPGTVGPHGATGPPLTAMARQSYVAGVIPNTTETLARFIVNPQAIDPRSAMPNLGVSAEDAGVIAAYLHAASEER